MGVLFNDPQWSNRYHRVAEEANAAVDVAWQPQKRGAAIRVLVTFDTAPRPPVMSRSSSIVRTATITTR